MAIEVPDTRGNGEPAPRRRSAAPRAKRAAAPPAEPAAAEPAPPAAAEPAPPSAAAEPAPPSAAAEPAPPSAAAESAPPAASESTPPSAAAESVPARSPFSRPAPRRRKQPAVDAPTVDAATPASPAPVLEAPAPEAPAPEAPAPEAPAPEAPAPAPPAPVRAGAPLPEPRPDAAPVAATPVSPEAGRGAEEEPSDVPTVVVHFGAARYALDMDAVAEVGRPPRVTRVPGVPSWVAGVVNWRGRVLAVLDLRPLLAVPQEPLPASGRVAVLSRDGITVGLLTERVEGVVPLDPERLEPTLPTLNPSAAALVSGQVTSPGGPIALVDLDSVFALRHQLPRVRRGA